MNTLIELGSTVRDVKEARKTMVNAFDEEDSDLEIGYLSNIAMLLYDRRICSLEKANDVAKDILDLIFR